MSKKIVNELNENIILESILRSSTDMAIAAIDLEFRILYYNPVAEKIFGYTKEEVVGKTVMEIHTKESVEPSRFEKAIETVRKEGEYRYVVEQENEEGICFIESRVSGIWDEQKSLIGFVLMSQDVTEKRRVEKMLLEIEERERRRIGHELHDSLGQLLAGISFRVQYLENNLKEGVIPVADEIEIIKSLTVQAKKQVKSLVKGILPVETHGEGLMLALKELTSNTEEIFKISSDFKCDDIVCINNDSAVTHLYRIAQEAVTNAVKHAAPGHINVYLNRKNDGVEMIIKDDGTGMPELSGRTNGLGLQIIKYRANIIGALLEIKTDPEGGTVVTCAYPDKNNVKE